MRHWAPSLNVSSGFGYQPQCVIEPQPLPFMSNWHWCSLPTYRRIAVPAQHALEAAEAAARVVVDAMEAESAAGRTTPPAVGQPLEPIQLFEQADSKDVRSSGFHVFAAEVK